MTKVRKQKGQSLCESYIEQVDETEENVRDSIATALPEYPDRAREYNDLLNISKNLNKIMPSTMTKQLFETKCKKYKKKLQDPWKELMLVHGYMT